MSGNTDNYPSVPQAMPLMEYGARYRAVRRLAHVALQPAAVHQYATMQEDYAALLAQHLLDKPSDFFDHIRLCV